MTDQEFCRIDTAINGEVIDKVEQLTSVRFTGRELKEYVERFIKIKEDTWNRVGLTKVCTQISEDMQNDAAEFDGKPFTGKTVAEYFGNQGAAIAALANVVESLIKQSK